MSQVMTWKEIEKKYPNMWVSIIDPEYKDQSISTGKVLSASEDQKKLISEFKDILAKDEIEFNTHTIVWTGDIPYIVGLSSIETQDVQA